MTASADPAEIFRQEASELLEQLEAALLDLEQSPDDHDLINTAFRALHTIKGSGAMFGFDEVAAFAHEFESAFDRVRKGEAAPDPELIAIALGAKDFIRAQIEKPDEANAVIGVCILSDLRKLGPGPRRRVRSPRPPSPRRRTRSGARAASSEPGAWACASTRTCSSTAAIRCSSSTSSPASASAGSWSTPPRRRRSTRSTPGLLFHLGRRADDGASPQRDRRRLHLRARRDGAQHRRGRGSPPPSAAEASAEKPRPIVGARAPERRGGGDRRCRAAPAKRRRQGKRNDPRAGRAARRNDGSRRRAGDRPGAALPSSPPSAPTPRASPRKSNGSPPRCATR